MPSQALFRTVGGDTCSARRNSVEVMTTTLNYAAQNREQFNQIVMSMFHEYLHAWQKSSAGIESHVEREAQAHFFTLFPGQFSEWRRANCSSARREGEIHGPPEPHLRSSASFPQQNSTSIHHKIMYASDFEDYYSRLTPKQQAKYRPMDEKVQSFISENEVRAEKFLEHQAMAAYFKALPEELPEWRKTQLGFESEENGPITAATQAVKEEMAGKFEDAYLKMNAGGRERFRSMYEKMLAILVETNTASAAPASANVSRERARDTIARAVPLAPKVLPISRKAPRIVTRRAVPTAVPSKQEAAPVTPPAAPPASPSRGVPILPGEVPDSTTFDFDK